MGGSKDNSIYNQRAFQQDCLHLGGKDLLTTNIYLLRLPPQNPNIFTMLLNTVSRPKVTIGCKGRGGIQVAKHRGFRLDLKHVINDPDVVSISADFD